MSKDKKEYYFVYGTLKRGFGNGTRIFGASQTAEFIETANTEPEYTMIGLGGFPGVMDEGKTSIHGEIWSVSDQDTKNRLDSLEGYNPRNPKSGLYDKKIINLNDKNVNIYIINGRYQNSNIITNGTWE